MTDIKEQEKKIMIKVQQDYGVSIITLIMLIGGYYLGKQQEWFWLWMSSQIILIVYAIMISILLLIMFSSGLVMIWIPIKNWFKGK